MADSTLRLPGAAGTEAAFRIIDNGDGSFSFDAGQKGIRAGVLGHYTVSHRCGIIALQAANSRLFEVRNTHATNLIIPTHLAVSWFQTGAFTAAIEDSLDLYKVTGFSAVDTTNTVTPTASRKRTSFAAPPGGASIRGVTVAGAAAGMTGGTLVKDGGALCGLGNFFQATAPTTGPLVVGDELLACTEGEHPFVFAQNEGFILENRVLLGAAAAAAVYIDFSWAEVGAF